MSTPGAATTCPRCGGGFHCGAADPIPCACSSLALPAALLQDLRGQYSGCLCLACLRQLAGDDATAAASDTTATAAAPRGAG